MTLKIISNSLTCLSAQNIMKLHCVISYQVSSKNVYLFGDRLIDIKFKDFILFVQELDLNSQTN